MSDTPATCPRCGATFACGINAREPCACTRVALSADQRAALAQHFESCLCGACLQAVAGGTRIAPDLPVTPMVPGAAGAAALRPFELPVPDLGPWRAGNTGTEGVWHFDSGQPGRRVLITALVHGNELCGAWAVKGLLDAGVRPQQGTLTLAFCNLAAFDRFDAQAWDQSRFAEEDFNRVWQADKLADPRTSERRRALQLQPFALASDWLLDIHSMTEPGPPLQLTGVMPRHLALARQLGAPAHVVVDAGHQDGTRLRDFGRFGLPDDLADGLADGQPDGQASNQAGDSRSLLIECGFHGALSSRDVAQDQCARFLVAAGTLDAATAAALLPGWRGLDAPEQWALAVTGAVVARSAGFRFTLPLTGLAVVAQAGTVIGDNDGEPVTTPYDDCVMVMPSTRLARPGVTVVRLARRTRLA